MAAYPQRNLVEKERVQTEIKLSLFTLEFMMTQVAKNIVLLWINTARNS